MVTVKAILDSARTRKIKPNRRHMLAVELSPEVFEKFDAFCYSRGVSKAGVVRAIVEQVLLEEVK
jgi:hypothetical protein